ncbi:unnamed protein product [Vicia faba]|uniref:E2 ubiquitin-conjugating enzyme n=1 Tax=Vicia faba TaxID=3906 RepID=A0AAV0Z8D0_VICFA|nr:unnamed protein product [Vicia faba]
MDPDVVEIPPSMFQHPPRFIKQKQPGAVNSGTVSGIESSNRQPSVSHIVINVDGRGSHPSFDNDNYLDLSSDECKEVDEYTLLQAQFDNVDLPTGIEAPFKIGSSSLQIKTDNVDLSSGTQLSSKPVPAKKNALEVELSNSRRFMKSIRSKVMSAFFGSKKHGLADNPDAMKPPNLRQFESAKQGAGSANPDSSTSALKSARDVHNGATAVLPQLTLIDETENETMRKLRSFKQFDIVIDTSDHHFINHNHNSSTKQNPKSWAKKIQEEWKILEKHLPDTIFVRVYESRMDLMRAVIIGAEGTPYHDGLFFFDIFFPSGYPNVPPKVHYHSGGLQINPNLYHCGKVCLSLLNTWPGSRKEKWTKGVSTMLQVLVSIQGLILNTTPFFNEPGLEDMRGTPNGEMHSLQYNEDTFIKSLQTMVYTIKKPPKNFEDLVAGHFYSRVHDILASCKAYMEGVQVGCLVKGGVQDVNGSKGNQSSAHFISGLAGCVPSLVKEFENIGVDCKKFASLLVPYRTIGRK